MRILTVMLMLGLLLSLCVGASAEDAKKATTFPAVKLKTIDGGEFNTGSLKGKPFVANFWATW